MRTIVYVDGYNLYYGSLKNGPYKWLNIHSLCSRIVNERAPGSNILECRFYTAMVKARIASHGARSVQAQEIYHRALESPYTPPVTVIKSAHYLERDRLMRYTKGAQPNREDKVEVWRMEEKQTDVRIALDAFRAATTGTVDQVVLVTNDTDLIPLFSLLEDCAPSIQRGLIVPRLPTNPRPAAKDLLGGAHWNRGHLLPEELAEHQFQPRVPTAKKPACKPDYW